MRPIPDDHIRSLPLTYVSKKKAAEACVTIAALTFSPTAYAVALKCELGKNGSTLISSTLSPAAPCTFWSGPTSPPLFLGIMAAVQHGCLYEKIIWSLVLLLRSASVCWVSVGFWVFVPFFCFVGV